MAQHDDAVLRQVHVGLERVGAVGDGLLMRKQRILRIHAVRASVRYHLGECVGGAAVAGIVRVWAAQGEGSWRR